jgi:hypothetical protein
MEGLNLTGTGTNGLETYYIPGEDFLIPDL